MAGKAAVTRFLVFTLRRMAVWGLVATVLAGVFVFAALMGGGEVENATINAQNASCGVPSGAQTDVEVGELSPEQLDYAATIISVGNSYGLSPEEGRQAQKIAIATALQESTLRNIDYGDRDSLGLFQQRPSQGWGTPAEITDPVYASKAFYEGLPGNPGLFDIDGWQAQRLTIAAQKVQRSAFPEAYQKWEALATEIVDKVGPSLKVNAPDASTQGSAPGQKLPAAPASPASGDPAGTEVSLCTVGTVSTVGVDSNIVPQPAGKSADGKNSQRAVYAKEKILAVFGCDTGRVPCVKTIGGQANRNDGGKSDHNRGLALDVMIGSGCVPPDSPENKLGDEVKAWVDAHAGPLNVTYVIWEDIISYPTDPSKKTKSQNKLKGPSTCTYAHQDHPHISFRED